MNKYQRRIIEEKLGSMLSYKKVSKWRAVYQLVFKDKILRLDILKKNDETLNCHRLCLDKGLNCFPEIKEVLRSGGFDLKISVWVEGKTYSELYESGLLTEAMMVQMGSFLAKTNNIRNGSLYLHNDDVTYHNVMLDAEGCFMMFDLDRLSFVKDVDGALVKTLLKRIGNKNMIDSFLSGYEKYRDTSNLVSLCAKRNWKWKWNK